MYVLSKRSNKSAYSNKWGWKNERAGQRELGKKNKKKQVDKKVNFRIWALNVFLFI